jgi:hypothetical protein
MHAQRQWTRLLPGLSRENTKLLRESTLDPWESASQSVSSRASCSSTPNRPISRSKPGSEPSRARVRRSLLPRRSSLRSAWTSRSTRAEENRGVCSRRRRPRPLLHPSSPRHDNHGSTAERCTQCLTTTEDHAASAKHQTRGLDLLTVMRSRRGPHRRPPTTYSTTTAQGN